MLGMLGRTSRRAARSKERSPVDPTRFDHLVKSLQTTTSRRRAIRMLGGAAAGLAALAGLRSAFARETQPDDPAAPPPADGDPGAASEELLSAQNTFVR